MKRIHKRILPATCAAIIALAGLASCTSTPATTAQSLTDYVMRGDLEGIKKFYSNQEQLNQKDSQGLYPLHYAVTRGNTQIVEILIVLGAKVDVQDPAGKTPLRYAVDRGLVDTVKLLVERGANPFLADASGATAAEAVLMAGGDMIPAVFTPKNINASGIDGRTGLHIAADRLLKDVVYKLLDLGAQAQIRDKAGRTPLDLVLLYPDRVEAANIAERLIQRGANQSFPEFAWFVKAVRAMDYSSVRYEDDNTPLHEAVMRKQKGFVIFLLDRRVALNVRNRLGNAPLHEAIKMGWLEGAGLLLAGGADPNVRNAENGTPLHIAMPEAIMLSGTKLLLKYKADPTLKDNGGNTPLHIAVQNGYPTEILSTLVAAGASANSANSAGDTPLILAVRSGHLEFAPPLIENGADLFLQNLKQESALSLAVASGTQAVDAVVTKTNVAQRDNLGNGVLATAVGLEGSDEVISLLLSKGADPNLRNNSGDTALHVAVRRNLESQGSILLGAKADIFSMNTRGESPLILGLEHKDGPLEWLFTPAILASRDANGDSPLHYAARRNLSAGILFLAGKEPKLLSAINGANETPLHSAVRVDGAEAARVLLSLGAKTTDRDSMGDAPLNTSVLWNSDECMKVLILAGANPDIRNFAGETPLHQAVRKRNGAALRYLLDHGASIDPRDSRGQTPLSVAASGSAGELAKTLLAAKAEIDARDLSGKTPLYISVESGNLELLRIFVAAGADIFARNGAGESPLTESFRKGTAQLRELLSPASANRTDSEGKTALRVIVDYGMSVEHIETALAAGALTDIRDRHSETPLYAALKRKDLTSAVRLIQAGSDLFAPNAENVSPAAIAIGMGPDAIRMIVTAAGKTKDGPGIKISDSLGNSLLHYAAMAGNTEAAKVLLELGADPSQKNIAGETAAGLAVKRENRALAEILAVK